MTWSVLQTRRFARQYKKLHDNTAIDVDLAVDEIRQKPEIGERKKGDLAALRVFKFRSAGQLYLSRFEGEFKLAAAEVNSRSGFATQIETFEKRCVSVIP